MKISFLFIFSLFASSALAQSIQPGTWRAKTTVELNGMPLPASEAEECITKSEAQDLKPNIAKELKKKGCDITKWTVKGQNLEASLQCKNKQLQAKGQLKGTVTAKKYDLSGNAEGSFNGFPSSATMKLTGNWVKSCVR